MTYPAVYGPTYSAQVVQAMPSRLGWLGIARELAQGVATTPVAAVPVNLDAWEPEDTPTFIYDMGLRASQGSVAGAVLGPLEGTLTFGAPVYADSVGYWLDNLLGDLSATINGGSGIPQLLAQSATAGDTAIYASGGLMPLGAAVPAGTAVQISDGTASEVLVAGTGCTSTVVRCPATPCRFGHATSATATAITSGITGYTHAFNVLNSGSGLPSTHTLTDTTGLTPITGQRCYPCASVTQIDLAGDPATGFVTGKVSGVCWPSQPAPSFTAFVPSTVAAFAGWQSTVTVNGTVPFASAWAVSMKRDTVVYRSAANSQFPWVIARGGLVCTGTLTYPLPVDETPLGQMLSQGPIPVQIGVASGSQSLTVLASMAQFVKAKHVRTQTATGYATAWQALDNATNSGGSGGIGPVSLTLVSPTAAY